MHNTSAFTFPKRSTISHTVQDEKTPSHNDNRNLYFHCHLFIGGGGAYLILSAGPQRPTHCTPHQPAGNKRRLLIVMVTGRKRLTEHGMGFYLLNILGFQQAMGFRNGEVHSLWVWILKLSHSLRSIVGYQCSIDGHLIFKS